MKTTMKSCAVPDEGRVCPARPVFNLFKVSLFIVLSFATGGCALLKEKICDAGEGPEGPVSASTDAQGTAAAGAAARGANGSGGKDAGSEAEAEPDRHVFLYSRAKYIVNPVVLPGATKETDGEVLHMCWYKAETVQDFRSASAFEISLQADAAIARVESLYAYYTATAELSARFRESMQNNASEWLKLGLARQDIIMGELDRIALGLETSIHPAISSLIPLLYFGGVFAHQPHAAERLTLSSLDADRKAGRKARGPESPLTSLSPAATTWLDKALRGWGTNAPTERILRLPLEVVAQYACPEY